MRNLVRASLVLFSIVLFYEVVGRAVPDDGCWYGCPFIWNPICGKEENSTQEFSNKCIMERHNECFETSRLSDKNLNNSVYPLY